jgi:hypothetical protein
VKAAALVAAPWAAALLLRLWGAYRTADVEAYYSRGLYPHVAGLLARVSACTAFSLAEGVCLVALLASPLLVVRMFRRVRRSGFGWRGLGKGSLWTAGILGVVYVLFLLCWGLNYDRLPLATILALDARPSERAALAALAEDLVARANAAREGLPEGPDGAIVLSGGRDAALSGVATGFAGLGSRLPIFSRWARVKAPFASPLLSYLGIAGLYVPFTAEPHLNGTLPDSEIPFTASHEMAHEQGFAREDEANFVSYLACRAHPQPVFRYSGELRASLYAISALHGIDPRGARELQARRSAAVRRDLAALNAWHDRYASRAGEVQRRVNDAYLKSQGQKLGVQSYGRMVDLLLAERRLNPDRPRGPAAP